MQHDERAFIRFAALSPIQSKAATVKASSGDLKPPDAMIGNRYNPRQPNR
jgi:hypothetical protein